MPQNILVGRRTKKCERIKNSKGKETRANERKKQRCRNIIIQRRDTVKKVSLHESGHEIKLKILIN